MALHCSVRGVECYVPLYHATRRWGTRVASADLPLFPGYVFVRCTPELRSMIVAVPGFVRMVTFQGRAAILPDEEVAAIRAACETLGAEPHPYVKPGRHVRIKSGSMAGLEGQVLRRRSGTRFVVAVEPIHRAFSVSIDISAEDLEVLGSRSIKR